MSPKFRGRASARALRPERTSRSASCCLLAVFLERCCPQAAVRAPPVRAARARGASAGAGGKSAFGARCAQLHSRGHDPRVVAAAFSRDRCGVNAGHCLRTRCFLRRPRSIRTAGRLSDRTGPCFPLAEICFWKQAPRPCVSNFVPTSPPQEALGRIHSGTSLPMQATPYNTRTRRAPRAMDTQRARTAAAHKPGCREQHAQRVVSLRARSSRRNLTRHRACSTRRAAKCDRSAQAQIKRRRQLSSPTDPRGVEEYAGRRGAPAVDSLARSAPPAAAFTHRAKLAVLRPRGASGALA